MTIVEAPIARFWKTSRTGQIASVILWNLAVLFVTLVISSLIIFFALHYLPGDLAVIIAGMDATPEQVELIRSELGLDRPVIIQYFDWIFGALQADLGYSTLDRVSIADQLAQKLTITLPLGALALLFSVIIALPIGMIAGLKKDSWYGKAIAIFSQFGVAVPTFIVGLLLVVVLAVQTGWFPSQGFPVAGWADPLAALRALILPAITIAIPQAASLIRYVRSATIDLTSQDWLRTARSQGWSLSQIMFRQGLRNTALPLIAVLSLELAGILTGSVIVEKLFFLPGVGQMLLQDVGNREINKVQGTLLVLTALIMTISVLLNIVYKLVDPRLKATK